LVDRVYELEPTKRIRAAKAISFNEPFFQGHFPGHPVMPGVLIVEALAQAAGLMIMYGMTPEQRAANVTYFMGIDMARFRKPVTPGCILELRCELIRAKGPVFKQRGEASVDGQLCCEVEFMAMMAERG
jgi:beta-hydroxyacyl-ACP dehydratase FabZ